MVDLKFSTEPEEVLRRREAYYAKDPAADQGVLEPILVFHLSGQPQGVPLKAVQEVRFPYAVTRVPSMPSFVLGLSSVHGKVVTVIDIRPFVGLSEGSCGEQSNLIVLEYDGEWYGFPTEDTPVIHEIKRGEINPPTAALDSQVKGRLLGMIRLGDCLVSLLNLEDILASDALEELRGSSRDNERA